LTAYRLIDQPEGAQLVEAMKSVRQLSEVLMARIGTIQSELKEQHANFFSSNSAERSAAIAQLQEALQATVNQSLYKASQRFNTQRTEAIDQFFDRFARERKLLLDDLESRQTEFLELMVEMTETISVSGTLARELTETVNAIDRVVSRFDTDPDSRREQLRMSDVHDAAIETGRATEKMTLLLRQTNELFESESWNRQISLITEPAAELIDRLFWRGFILICLLTFGLALLLLIRHRYTGGRKIK
jgi:hypothetical protein